jgi:hypothetical protein
MNNVKRLVYLGVTIVILGGTAKVMITLRQAVPATASQPKQLAKGDLVRSRSAAQPAAAPTKHSKASARQENAQPSESAKASAPTNSTPQQASAGPKPSGPRAKEPVKDPMARVALAFIGADAAAEIYWYGAINDPTLPPDERQDLIEDLNEDGLSDPKHPTPEDLPVILSRLLLIEAAGPYAMDEVNADAFQEAYKDLVNLANLALGSGQPVR